MQVIGMHIGSSFAEVCIWNSKSKEMPPEKIARTLFYLPRQNLKTHLPTFLEPYASEGFAAAFVSSRYLQRLCDFRLGGGIAQVVTAGFEDWLSISNACLKTGWNQVAPAPSIQSTELTFGLTERMGADGQPVTAPDLSALEAAAEKWKQKGVAKVCLHLVHAGRNPTHQNLVADWLKQKEFEIFEPTLTAETEDVRWRTNTLEACFSGTQEDLIKMLSESLSSSVPVEQIYMHDGQEFRPLERTPAVGTLFGADRLAARHAESLGHGAALVFDPEEWYLLENQSSAYWQSPWGAVALEGPKRVSLPYQPSQVLSSCADSFLKISSHTEGFEPGPVMFGRGQKLMVLDAWADQPEMDTLFPKLVDANTLGRCRSQFTALSRSLREARPDTLGREIRDGIEESLQAFLALNGPTEFLVTGSCAGLWPSFSRKSTPVSSSEIVGLAGLKELA